MQPRQRAPQRQAGQQHQGDRDDQAVSQRQNGTSAAYLAAAFHRRARSGTLSRKIGKTATRVRKPVRLWNATHQFTVSSIIVKLLAARLTAIFSASVSPFALAQTADQQQPQREEIVV